MPGIRPRINRLGAAIAAMFGAASAPAPERLHQPAAKTSKSKSTREPYRFRRLKALSSRSREKSKEREARKARCLERAHTKRARKATIRLRTWVGRRKNFISTKRRSITA